MLQQFPRSEEAGLYRAKRQVGRLGNFLVTQFFYMAEKDDRAVVVGQSHDRLLQHQSFFACFQRVVGRTGPLEVRWVGEQRHGTPSPLQMVQAQVRGNPVDPGREPLLNTETVKVRVDADKRLLGKVLG